MVGFYDADIINVLKISGVTEVREVQIDPRREEFGNFFAQYNRPDPELTSPIIQTASREDASRILQELLENSGTLLADGAGRPNINTGGKSGNFLA